MYKPVTGNWDKMLHGKAASGTPRDPVQAPGLVDPAQYRRHHVTVSKPSAPGSETAS
jgi:starvation-inducible outer membrane lipoprotein